LIRRWLHAFALWLSARTDAPPTDAAIYAAVRRAYQDEGLNLAVFAPDLDLVSTGKVHAILHHAAKDAGKDYELRTVQDVCDWLAEAPARS
jgi:hypothetical protein